MKKYQIEVTERQLQLLSYACEKADRQIIGQLGISLENDCLDAWEREYKKENNIKGALRTLPEEWYDVRAKVEKHIDELRQLCWKCDKIHYYGINYDSHADTLFDLHRVCSVMLYGRRDRQDNVATSLLILKTRWITEPMAKNHLQKSLKS